MGRGEGKILVIIVVVFLLLLLFIGGVFLSISKRVGLREEEGIFLGLKVVITKCWGESRVIEDFFEEC